MSCKCTQKILKIKRLSERAILPKYMSESAAGFDLAIPEDIKLRGKEKILVKLGFAVAIPAGCEMQVRPRSGISLNTDLSLSNSPGTIDADYRGEVGLILENKSFEGIWFRRGERLAQAVIAPVIRCDIEEVEELDDTARGAGGFGSTGVI